MTAKEYLGQLRILDLKIRQRAEECEDLYHRAAGFKALDYSSDKVQTSPDPDGNMALVQQAWELERENIRMILRFNALKHKIIGQIHSMGDPRMAELLALRYVQYLPLEKIADVMRKGNGQPYSYDHIRRLHGEALQKFAKCHSNATFKCAIVQDSLKG